MNRAKPINVALHLLMTVALLAVVVSLVVAQSNSRRSTRAVSPRISRTVTQRPQMAHTGVGLSTKLPSWVMHRQFNAKLKQLASTWRPKGARSRVAGDNNVVRQTILLTRADETATNFTFVGSTAQDLHPAYTANEDYIYFDSDRVGVDANGVDNTTENATKTFNIFRMSPAGGAVEQVTSDAAQHLEPAVSGSNNVAYVAGGSITSDPDDTTKPLATNGFNLYVTSQTIGAPVTPLTGVTPPLFDDVRRPTFSPGGTDIAFAGRRNGESVYHIYTVSISSGAIQQYTSGASNDYSPAWSPSVSGLSVIAFTSNASTFTNGAAPIASGTPKGNDDIWVLQQNMSKPGARQVTNYSVPNAPAQVANNRNPAWTTSTVADPRTNGVQPNPLQPNVARIMLAFASNRAVLSANDPATGQPYAYPSALSGNGSTDIYMLDARIIQDATNSGVSTVSPTEIPFSAPAPGATVGTYTGARKLQTTNPQTDLDALDKPGAQIGTFDTDNVFFEDFPSFPQFMTTYRVAFQSNRALNLNIWASSILDLDAPELLEYNANNNEIVRVEHLDGTDLSTGRYTDAGSTVRFKVRAVDYQSGVKSVYLQIKCPDSQQQSDDSTEHKTFYNGPGQFSSTQLVDVAAYEWDSQAIKASDTQTGPKFRGPIPAGGSPNAPPYVPTIPGSPEFNWYTPGVEDFNAYSGNAAPPDDINAPGAGSNKDGNPGYWLQLTQDPVNQDTYTANWQTPIGFHSDMIIDVIVYDNAIYPFGNTGAASNWKIYDNIWGFTTRPFAANSQALYVSDYDTGQKFLNNRFGLSDFTSSTQVTNILTGVENQVQLTFEGNPTESWMTEFDSALFPHVTFNPASPTTPPNRLTHFETTLGLNGYGSNGIDPLAGSGPNGVPIVSQYDIWRIQCRGPIPTAVLNLYGPRTTQQPPDILATPPGTALRTQLIADRCVIWHSPYAGDLFVGPGTILDPNTQGQLTAFVAGGGRLFMSGQDVAFGLNLGTSPSGNAFLNNVLRATYVSDRAIAGGYTNDVINAGSSPNQRGQSPISYETWFGVLHPDFADPTKPGTDNPPLSAPPLYLAWTTINPTNRDYGCPNQGYETSTVVPVGFPNQVTFNPPAVAGGSATFSPGQYGIDGTYANGSPAIMWSRNAQNGRVVFSPFGWESINPDIVAIPMTTPTVYYMLNRRTELMHNVLDYLRTGRIVGTVRIRNSSGSVTGVAANAFVRAQAIDPVTLNLVTFGTAYTDNNGQYRIEGLDPLGVFQLDASKPGFTTQHAAGITFHGGYQAQSDQYIVQAQPAGLSGNVSTLSSNQPVAGAIVMAVDVTDRTLATKPTFLSNPTDASGNYTFNQLPASASGTTYDLSVLSGNVPGSFTTLGFSGSVALNPFAGLPGPPVIPANSAISEIKVVAGQTLTAGTLTNFKLTQPNGTATGIVVVADPTTGAATSTPIPGATVTASIVTDATNASVGTAQTGTDGTFSLSLGPGSYNLQASAPGYLAGGLVVVAVVSNQTQSSPRVVIALKALPPGAVSGLVTTSPPQSTPIGGATVTITDTTGKTLTATTGQVTTVTLSDGSTYSYNYVVPGVSAGSTVQVTATKAGYTPIPNPDTQTVNITSLTGTDPILTGTRNVNFVLDALHTYSNSLSLVSAPYEFAVTAGTLFSIPGADISSNAFEFVGWDASRQQYVFYPTPPADGFRFGQGYFLQETNTAVSLALTNPTYQGEPQDATGNYLPVSIPLQTGWNLIGDPFTNSLDLSKLQIQDGTALVDVPSAQTGTNPALGAALYTYDSGSYEIVYTIDPYRGYWIRAFRPVTLILTAGAQQNRGTRGIKPRTPLDIQSDKGEGWKLAFKATAGDGKTQTGSKAYFGVSTKATDGYDIYKMPVPPAMGKQAVQIAFDHKDWGTKAAGYMADIRSTQNTSWDFTVTSSVPNAPITLTWPGMASLSRRVDMQLLDMDTQQTFSLRSRSSIVIPNGGASLTKRYRVQQKLASHNTDLQLTNLIVTPSGTSRAAGGGAIPVGISYNLSADATVQVSIMQGGRRIRLVHSATRSAGLNQASWDLKTDTGSTVATNMYTVEVRAINPTTGRAVRQLQNVLVTR